ncbi:MAG: hypothetical protein K1X86_02395 [Ignavibacteria bacterium]|nr:hypothetical protein [Ignavibacteria bacterium]
MQKLHSYFFIIVILLISVFLVQGCKDDTVTSAPADNIDTTGLIRLNSSYAIGGRASVTLYLQDSLHTGYNKVYAVLRDSLTGALITDAHVIPSTTDHALGGPVESAPEEADAGGRFPFAIVLIESQSDNVMHWNIKVGVHNHGAPGEPYGTATFGSLHIKDNTGKFQTKSLGDGSTLYMSYINPKSPVTGLNNFEFLINKSYDTVYYAVDTSYTIALKPVLLSSGAASTGNVNPVPAGELRHYTGKINLPSAGEWRINMYMTKTGYSDSTFFDVRF